MRRLILATLVNTLGNGVYAAVGALYLTRAAGLSIGHVGIGLTVAGLIGLVTSTPVGVVADRLGPNRAYVGFLVLQAITMSALTQVRSFIPYVVVAGVTAIVAPGGSIRDQEIVAAADERNMAYLIAPRRHFRH